ncbi:hypothetical protein VTN96DRAFT_7719 [Rasamsonia emersonii]
MAQSEPVTLLSLAGEIFYETYNLIKQLRRDGIAEPSLEVGATSAVWTTHTGAIERARSTIWGLTKQLTKLLDGPHGFLHEYVSSNWDQGALYTLLESGVLEKIPLDEEVHGVHVSELAAKSGIPEDKLLCILRLNACEDIVREVSEGVFAHTAISEQLVRDPKFRAFIGFQLFETRVASAHLADTLKRKPNDYWTGQSAFNYAWGKPMYDWHRAHPDKAKRFQLAMEGVSQTLDPGNALFHDWFTTNTKGDARPLVIEIGGGDGPVSRFLAGEFPALSFEVQDASEALLAKGRQSLPSELQGRIQFQHHELFAPQEQKLPGRSTGKALIYIIRNILWNLPDEKCIRLLQTFVPVMANNQNAVVLVNELLSPAPGTFAPHVEKAYRRRDVTLTTMHNVKQRREGEWRALFEKASPEFSVNLTAGFTSHSSRGLWELRWAGGNRG